MPDEQMDAMGAACAETSRRAREVVEKGRELAGVFEKQKADADEMREKLGLDDGKMERFFDALPADARERAEAEWERVRDEIRREKEEARQAANANVPKPAVMKKRARNMV